MAIGPTTRSDENVKRRHERGNIGGEGELNSVLLGLYISSTVPLCTRAQERCESRGGRPGLPVTNSPYGLCGRKATLNLNSLYRLIDLSILSVVVNLSSLCERDRGGKGSVSVFSGGRGGGGWGGGGFMSFCSVHV